MLTQVSDFLDDGTGIEKTLRLAQGLCTVLAGLSTTTAAAAPWSAAKSQVNLGRRYLRLHKWHPCFRTAYSHSNRSDLGAFEKLLEVAKWSFLGLYFLLEMPTLTNAMGLTTYEWGDRLQTEALKCWFYGIGVSILLGYYQLITLYFFSSQPPAAVSKTANGKSAQSEKKAEKASSPSGEEVARRAGFEATRGRIVTQLTIDMADIFLPGSALGWAKVGPVVVGTCQSASSVLAMQQVWARMNAVK